MPEPLEFTLSINDFMPYLLPDEAIEPGTDRFKLAVAKFYRDQFAPVGGSVVVSVDSQDIHVTWIPDAVSENPFAYVLSLLRGGELQKAVPLLEALLAANPDDADVLYNLGMALSDLGRLSEAKRFLIRALEVDPQNVNAMVALGVAQHRDSDADAALGTLQRAIELDPVSGYAHRNLGATLASLGRDEEAEEHLREAVRLLPEDQGALYGLATCLERIGDQGRITEADQLYREVIDLDPATRIAEVARSARAAIAEKGFRGSAPGGIRPDAMWYCLAALERFANMETAQVQAVAFEIAMLGRSGLNVNDAAQKYELASLPGNFSGLQLVSMMYVGFKQIAPEMDVGFDLSQEYDAAHQLFVSSEPNP